MPTHDAVLVANELSAARSSEEFLATAVHEIRGPAAVMLGVAETLKLLLEPEQLGPQGAELLDTLIRNGRHLRALVIDLLNSAYLEQGSLPLRMATLPIRPLLGWAVETAGAAPGDVYIDCDPALHGYVDPDRLEQVVTNLVSNAVEHGATPFCIVARPLSHSEGVTIVVSDQGKGVGVADAERLFDRFGALAARTSSSTGLGLSISRSLARAMGGELIYRRLTAGSSFVLTLPDYRSDGTGGAD